jgi:RNA polymerase sigma factor (sigma-70 family)
MAQGSSEPTAEQAGSLGSTDPATLWEAFGPPLRTFLARRVPPGVEPDDLLQDVFLRVVKHLDSLRSTERPEAWLFQIARNEVREALRAGQRRDGRTDPLDVDLPAKTDTAAVRDSEEELAPCLAEATRLSAPRDQPSTSDALLPLSSTRTSRNPAATSSASTSATSAAPETQPEYTPGPNRPQPADHSPLQFARTSLAPRPLPAHCLPSLP